MGSLQPKPDIAAADQASTVEVQTITPDKLIAALAANTVEQLHAETLRLHLAQTPFDVLLSAIERSRPTIARATEIFLYQQWIDANVGLSPLLYAGWFNLGIQLAASGDHLGAAVAYSNTLALRPDMHSAAINLGLLFEQTGQPEQALAAWKRAVQPDDARLALEIQQGRLLEKLGRFEEAEECLRKVLLANPEQPDVLHQWVHIRQKPASGLLHPTPCPALSPKTSCADLDHSAFLL